MAANQGLLIIQEDTQLKGKIRNCRLLEVYGYVEGELTAERLIVHKGGSFYGRAKTDSAEIHGTLEGNVSIKNLISIRGSGSVSGNIQYGQLAMESGASLSADVRNVPPSIAGDLDLTVYKGRTVGVTEADLTALDPDDDARDLIYTISNAQNGYIVMVDALGSRVDTFSQADLEAGKVVFHHDDSNTSHASFDVIVTDSTGATSGTPQTVNVTVRAGR